jgi:hypothetical protein
METNHHLPKEHHFCKLCLQELSVNEHFISKLQETVAPLFPPPPPPPPPRNETKHRYGYRTAKKRCQSYGTEFPNLETSYSTVGDVSWPYRPVQLAFRASLRQNKKKKRGSWGPQTINYNFFLHFLCFSCIIIAFFFASLCFSCNIMSYFVPSRFRKLRNVSPFRAT